MGKLDGIGRTLTPIVGGVTKHLLDIESKLGLVLLVMGFLLLGFGMFSNAASFLVGSGQ